jgi:pyruvate kinase
MHRIQHSKALWYTVGPASLGKEEELFPSGATGIRLTFSFATPDLQLERATTIKMAARSVGCDCTVVADLAGEKVRLGAFSNAPTVEARLGARVRLVPVETANPSPEDLTLPVPNAAFMARLKKGNVITVGDGAAVITITEATDSNAVGEITDSGVINQTRGLTVQGSDFCPQSLTAKDLSDLKHILSRQEYDCVALSFVASEADVLQVRDLMAKMGRSMPIVAKIETQAGVDNIDKICRVADCLMAARGDLALAIPWVELPGAVDRIAKASIAAGKPWILATQVAEGLERFAIPTRAEVCDLANWLKEGTAGVLLSYETAFGARPVAAVACTAQILRRWGNPDAPRF